MPEEQTDPMADYQAKLEEHEFLKREGVRAWIDALLDLLGDHISEDKRPLIIEGLSRFMGVGAPKYPTLPGLDVPTSFIVGPGGPPTADAEFVIPIFEETGEDGVTRVYDWVSIAQGATHAEHFPKIGHVALYNYADHLMTLKGPAAASFWEWSEKMRGPMKTAPARRIRRRPHGPRRTE